MTRFNQARVVAPLGHDAEVTARFNFTDLRQKANNLAERPLIACIDSLASIWMLRRGQIALMSYLQMQLPHKSNQRGVERNFTNTYRLTQFRQGNYSATESVSASVSNRYVRALSSV